MQRESTLPILLWFLLKFGIWPGLMQIKSFQQRRGGSRLDVVGASISRFFYCNDLPGSEKAELIDRATGFTACAANSMLRSSRTGNPTIRSAREPTSCGADCAPTLSQVALLSDDGMPHREFTAPMTSIATLLTRKQDLLSRLEESPGPNERAEIERLLDKIDAELNAVDRPDRL
jgi:hypothetical protein